MGLPACAAGLKRPSKALQWSLPVGLSRQCLTSLVMVAKVMGLPAGTAGLKRHIRITMEFASWTILPVLDISRYGSEGEDGAPTPPAPVPASPPPVTLTPMAREAKVNALKAQCTAQTPLCRRTTAPTLTRTLQPLLRARPPKLASGVVCMASSSPTNSTRNASFTALLLRLSPGGTGSAVRAATGAVIWVMPSCEGTGQGPVSLLTLLCNLGPGSTYVVSRWRPC